MSICEYCGDEFARKTFNQKYCTRECTKLATNENIMERYYERKRNRAGARRLCNHHGCDTVLSRYNDDRLCSVHAGFNYTLEFTV